LLDGERLSEADAVRVMQYMLGDATDAQIAALLVAMRARGETPEELAGLARVMRERAVRISPQRRPLLDTCGTGGDALNTLNVSTAAAFVASAAGATVAKHGNRSVSSACGSSDVLSALGIEAQLPPDRVESLIDSAGLGFMHAPLFHPAMARVAPVRQELGVRTVFNILGPLSNPAGAKRQLLGVYDAGVAPVVADALRRLGCEHGLVVCGERLDEVSTAGPTSAWEVSPHGVEHYEVSPEDLGVPRAGAHEIAGGSAEENARAIVKIFSGETGPRTDIVIANGGAALYVAGIAKDLADGGELACQTIADGAALAKLRELADVAGNPERLEALL